MRKILFLLAMLAISISGNAQDKLTLTNLGSAFQAESVRGLNPIPGTDQYAKIEDNGTKIVQYSFKTGKPTSVLFDASNTIKEQIKRLDGYIFSPDGKKMLIQTNTESVYRRSFKADYYLYNIQSRRLEKLSDGGKQQVPVFSNDGLQVAFVRDNNIFLVKLLYDNAESQVTKDGEFNKVINGIPDWVNEEEFSFNSSLCFSADGTHICWLRYDESEVETYSLQLYKGDAPAYEDYADYPGAYTYKYPKAGHRNATVTAWSYDIKARRPQQLQVPVDADGYMPRIIPTENNDRILIYTLNRHQDQFRIYGVNPSSTVAQLLIEDNVKKYVSEAEVVNTIVGKNSILVPSDRDGFHQLYIYSMTGQLQRRIGDGKSDITDVYGYDELTGDVYYQAASLSPMDRQVYVTHKNGKTDRLTDAEGWNDALFSGDFKYFVNTWSNRNTPYVVTVRNNLGKTLSTVVNNATLKSNLERNNWNRREFFSFTTSEGVQLNGWMLKPTGFDASKKYPVIMHQYSGPASQQVVDSWKCGSHGQGYDYYLAQEGYVVVSVDGRGTGARGAEFEKCTYLHLGELESKDQVEAALWLGKQSYVDKDRIAIWGWSYGGFNTLMSMSEGRPVFNCGIAIAPPTCFRYYDTIYTERFMRTPQENQSGYDVNPITRASQLSGALLICHGMADDNVHPQNTFEYSEALVQADKDFVELLYTNRNHSIYGGNTRTHLMRQWTNFFNQHLK